MMLKSFLTGPDQARYFSPIYFSHVYFQVPDQRVREMVLEEHLECGCACDELTPMECLGRWGESFYFLSSYFFGLIFLRFNRTTCECGCPVSMFGQVSYGVIKVSNRSGGGNIITAVSASASSDISVILCHFFQ